MMTKTLPINRSDPPPASTQLTKKARTTACSPWPSLPADIAGEVLLRLPSYADRICFGAACRSWRASAAQHHAPPRLPCLVFPDGSFGAFPWGHRPFRLPRAAGHHVCCGEWLVFKRDGDGDGGYYLANPFSDDAAAAVVAPAPLPSLSAARVHDEPAGAARERVLEEYDVTGLVLRGLDGDGVEPAPRTASLRKLVVCSAAGLVAAVVGEGRLGKLALCRPGAAAWWVCGRGDHQWRRLKDIATHRGDLYAVDHNEDLLAVTVDHNNDGAGGPTVSGIRRVINGDPPDLEMARSFTLHYLVDAGNDDDLLMVRREVRTANIPGRFVGVEERLTVFRADFASSRWAEVTTLGDGGVALFVGQWGSRAVRAPDEHRKWWTDQIFILDDGAGDQPVWSPQYSLSVYDMGLWRTFKILHVMQRDGNTLWPGTWLFPRQGTRDAADAAR